jgi:hypothetical protein
MEGQTMLRALSLAILMTAATLNTPSFAAETADDAILAQQQQQSTPPQSQRRGCDKNQDGIS